MRNVQSKMAAIHPSSVIDRGAQIADDVTIGPLCYVGPKVTIGPRCRLISHVSVLGKTTLGSGNAIWPHVVLGADPQDLKYKGEESALIIGDDNVLRELVTAHTGTGVGGGATRIGNGNLIMGGVHIAHDCEIGNHVLIANNVGLAGHVRVEDHANISGQVGVHHFVTFGQYCFVGGMSRIVQDVPPFMIVEGNPSLVHCLNKIGLKRHQFAAESIERLDQCFRRLYRAKAGQGGPSTMLERLNALESEFPHDPHVKILIQSLRHSATAGPHGRYRELSFRRMISLPPAGRNERNALNGSCPLSLDRPIPRRSSQMSSPIPWETVFTPGRYPEKTYIARKSERYEQQLKYYLWIRGFLISIAGPSKSGKTVLVHRVARELKANVVFINGSNISSPDHLWMQVISRLGRAGSKNLMKLVTPLPTRLAERATAQAEIPFGTKVIAGIHSKSSGSRQTKTTETFLQTHMQSAFDYLLAQDCILVIDDLHYIKTETCRDITRQLKDAIYQGIRVIVISVFYRGDLTLYARILT